MITPNRSFTIGQVDNGFILSFTKHTDDDWEFERSTFIASSLEEVLRMIRQELDKDG